MSSGKIGIFFYREHTLITGVHVHLCKLSNEARTCAGSWYKPLRHLKKKIYLNQLYPSLQNSR